MKLNGYRATHRNRWNLIRSKILTSQEFLLFEYYLDIMDFDPNHGNSFGSFEVFPNEIAPVFNKGTDTIKAWHKELLLKGFIQAFDDKRSLFKIKSPHRYITQWGGKAHKFAKDEKNIEALGLLLENVCFSSDKVGKNQEISPILDTNDTSKALGSSKDELSKDSSGKKIVLIKQEPRSESEYNQIQKESNYTDLSIEDMKWIDENVIERIEVTDKNEQEIVDIYFDGDWDEYRKNLILG